MSPANRPAGRLNGSTEDGTVSHNCVVKNDTYGAGFQVSPLRA